MYTTNSTRFGNGWLYLGGDIRSGKRKVIKMEQIIFNIITALAPGIITGIVLAWWNRRDKKRDEARSSAEADRIESEMMRIDLLVAAAQLSYAVAIAQKRGSTNGETEAGIEKYEKAMEKFRKFERKQVAKAGAE